MTLQERLAPGKYRLTVDDYLRLDDAGVFGGRRTELLGGDVIVMNSEYRPHAYTKMELGYRLRRALEQLGSDLYAMDASVAASSFDVPLPDLVLTREPRGEGLIPLGSVALVVEISSTTLRRDMGKKAAMYARTGIPEYWVVNFKGRVIHQMWSPTADSFAQRTELAFGERIPARTIPDLWIDTSGL